MAGIKYMELLILVLSEKRVRKYGLKREKSDEFELLELREIFKLILLSCGVEFEWTFYRSWYEQNQRKRDLLF